MEDHFDIRSLPSNFVSESHPSQIIEKLNEKRKKAHSVVLEEIICRKKEINVGIEEEILNKSNKAKLKLKQIRDDTDYLIYLIQHMREHEFDTVEKNYFQNISKKVINYNESRKANVDELYDALVAIEKKRGEELKAMLRETYEKLLNISYKLPFELEEFFEKEILKINQLTLNNYNNYVELQAELKLQIENDMKTWMQKIYEIKEQFQKHLKDAATQVSGKSNADLQPGFIDTTFARMNRRLSEYDAMKMVLEFKLSQIYVHVDLKNIHLWLQDVQMTMACLDRSAKYIVNIYKAAIVVIFHRFFKELEDIKTSMLDIDMLSREEIEPYECEIYTPTAEELDLKDEKEFHTIKEVWGKLITYIEDSLNETYAFVKKSTYLWDNHFIRIEECQELVLEDVNNTIEKNIIIEESFEGKLNVLLDKLRQCPTEQKLERCLGDVRKNLDKVEELYHTHNIEEQKVCEKYKELVDFEIDVLMTEIKRFLVLHPPDEERDPKKQRKRASQESQIRVDPTEEMIPHQMLFCRYEVDAVANWMFGLWEAINHYLTCGRVEIMVNTEEWVKIQCSKIKEKLDVKLALFRTRYERIHYSIYEKRLEELSLHTKRLQTHQMAVELELKNLVKTQCLNEDKYNDVLNTFANKKDAIIKQILNSSRSSHIRRFKDSLRTAIEDAINAINCILESSNKACDELAMHIKLANMKFKKAIRLFSEDGNYEVEEAKIALKNLNKVDSNAEKSLELMRKDNKSMHNNYKNKLEARSLEASSSTQEIIEELEHNEKNVKTIMQLQNEIRSTVISVKTSTMKLKKMFKNLIGASTKKLGGDEYLPIFIKKFEEIVEKIKSDGPFLIHPEPVFLFSLVNTKWPSVSLTNDHFEDFTKYIFDAKPEENDERFVSKLNNALYESLSKIQAEAKEFYSHHKILLDFPKIQPTYSKFMTEVLRKYKNLLIQSEISWIENTSDFANFLGHFLDFEQGYKSTFENTFYNVNLGYYAKVQNDIMKKLCNDKEELEGSYKKMHSKLKPLYGHPNNAVLLKRLGQEFQNLSKDNEIKVKAILPPYKNILYDEFEKIKSKYEITRNELNCVSLDESITQMQTTLNSQLFTKLDLMREIMEGGEKQSDTSSEYRKQEDFPLSVSREIITYMKNIQSRPQTNSGTTTTTTSISSTLATTTTSEEPSSRDFLDELQKNFTKYDQIITDFVNEKLLGYHTEFQLTWANNVQNVVNLFKVKYDTNNLSSK